MRAAFRMGDATALPGAERDWARRFWAVLGCVMVIRVVYAALFPLDLAPDESYYWDWGRRLDYGYFSKPPMIGWLMALAGWVGVDSVFGIKLFPVLLASAAVVFVFFLARDLYGAKAGFWAAMAFLATPANAALNTFFTIDAPLVLFWTASLWFAWRWWVAGVGEGGRWAAALTVSLGLGYLTKQIQWVFPLIWLVFLGISGRPERRLGLARVTAVVLGSMVFLLPPLLWNWQHDWITFRHTVDELEAVPFRWGRSAKFVAEFFGGQAGLGGGLLWVLMMGVAFGSVRRWRRLEARERFLLLFFLPGWLAYAALSVHQRVEQNWPLVFYPAAAVLVAGRVWGAGGGISWQRWFRGAIALGAALAVMLMAVPFVFPSSSWAGRKSDPTARVRGWRALADEVGVVRRGLPRPERTFLLAPRDRYVASALAFYLPDRPRTYCWEEPGRPESQYGIWGWPLERVGWDALVVEEDPRSPRLEEVAKHFRGWEARGEVVIRLGPDGARERRYSVYLGLGFKGGRLGKGEVEGWGIQLKSK